MCVELGKNIEFNGMWPSNVIWYAAICSYITLWSDGLKQWNLIGWFANVMCSGLLCPFECAFYIYGKGNHSYFTVNPGFIQFKFSAPFTREKKPSTEQKNGFICFAQSQLDANSSFVFLSHLFCWQPFYVDLDFKRPNKHMPNEWKSKMAIIRWPKRVWNSPHIRGLALRTLCIGSYFLITALSYAYFLFFRRAAANKN